MAGGSTDTIGLTVPPGSFVVKRGSSILNKELLDSIIKQKPKEYASGGSVPIIATDGETLIPPEIVDMYGIDFFRAINNSSDNAAHSNIDALIGQAQLANMKPMYGGGEVVPGYQEGGLVGLIKGLKSRFAGNGDEEEWQVPEINMEDVLANKQALDQNKMFTGLMSREDAFNKLLQSQLDVTEDTGLYDVTRHPSGDWGTSLIQEERDKMPWDEYRHIMQGAEDEQKKLSEKYYDVYPPIERGGKQYNFAQGGEVGEAGRQYPPGTLMSPFMGDKAPIPEAWMQPATESMPSPEEVAEFDRMIKTLQAQELLKKQMQKMQELGMFSDKEAVEYKDEGVQFPVRQEGYPQR